MRCAFGRQSEFVCRVLEEVSCGRFPGIGFPPVFTAETFHTLHRSWFRFWLERECQLGYRRSVFSDFQPDEAERIAGSGFAFFPGDAGVLAGGNGNASPGRVGATRHAFGACGRRAEHHDVVGDDDVFLRRWFVLSLLLRRHVKRGEQDHGKYGAECRGTLKRMFEHSTCRLE